MLLSLLREALEARNDARIEQAFAEATSQAVRETLTRALGQSKNFGLGNALTTAERLAAVKPSLFNRLTHGLGQEGFRPPDLAPQDIEVGSVEERVHLRFLVGAAVTPANVPGFTETAGNIGAVGSSIFDLLAGCRLETVQVAETVWLAKAASH